ncbi:MULTISPECIES: COG1361 S-layer family protein [Methanoculleus]|uniref:CARDB domain-containing protein n=2 Tax=Methanoculleus TaxID=45989 RepID=A3CSS5_METMJ|nr:MULTISPECIES: hypothetical protein [Methanoculleus]ABN56425.1 conserved hypothetical protein [Methanoculleus marisnigri JR1]MCC7554994.1 hypothetical protein [Methanoculleus marisnigri]UYU17872.1 hypothetical protein OH143_09175 [Methanoculleus submarinus]
MGTDRPGPVPVLLILACLLVSPAAGAQGNVTVTSVAVEPEVLMPGDSGFVTVTVQNTGPSTLLLGRARLYEDGVVPAGEPYPSVGDLGAGLNRTFTFAVRADAPDGTYYPRFSLDLRENGTLSHPVPVRVDGTPLEASVADRPDAFAAGREAAIAVQVGNPRPNAASGVRVIPEGANFSVTPGSAFIGTLEPDASGTVAFNLTPAAETNVTFRVVWRNGINTHAADLVLPVTFGEDKRQADPVITNVEVAVEGGIYRATGDVMNAGLEPARSVIISPGAPATPVDPFRVYVVGTLDSDDISTFEVTFRAGAGVEEIPLVIDYRDGDGNPYSVERPISLENRTAEEGADAGLPAPAVAAVALVAVAAGLAALWYVRRRRR